MGIGGPERVVILSPAATEGAEPGTLALPLTRGDLDPVLARAGL
jgi:hypothetical protein